MYCLYCYSNAFHNTTFQLLLCGVPCKRGLTSAMMCCHGRLQGTSMSFSKARWQEVPWVPWMFPRSIQFVRSTFPVERFLPHINVWISCYGTVMALPPPSLVSPPVPLHPPNLNQTDRNRPEPTGIFPLWIGRARHMSGVWAALQVFWRVLSGVSLSKVLRCLCALPSLDPEPLKSIGLFSLKIDSLTRVSWYFLYVNRSLSQW